MRVPIQAGPRDVAATFVRKIGESTARLRPFDRSNADTYESIGRPHVETLTVLGPFLPSIPIPGGSISVGTYSLSDYQLILMAVCVAVMLALAWLYNRTTFGLQARATMQNAAMARALGVNTSRIY
ncbi:MAG: hypothetical protein ABI579_09685, partial [Candidatus Sumerlaeota bacterium]